MTRPLCVLPLMFGFRLLLPGQVTVANPSFETPSVGGCPLFLYAPKDASWTFNSGGFTSAGCGTNFNAPAPVSGAGGQVAFIQSGGAGTVPSVMSQTVTGFVPGHRYVMRFYAAGRPPKDCDRCGPLNFAVTVGDVSILTVENPSISAFQQYTTRPFVAASPSLLIRFSGTTQQGLDEAAFIDLVEVLDAESPPPPTETVRSLPVPGKLLDCEGNYCEHGEAGGGIWIMNGKEGVGRWPNGMFGNLTVERFDSVAVIIHRLDPPGSRYAGETGTYTGKLVGDHVEGDVVWTWPGHWEHPATGKWSLKFGPTVAPLAYARSEYLDYLPPPAGILKIIPPKHRADLNGVWESVLGPNQVIRVRAEQTDNNVKLIDVRPGEPIDGTVEFEGHFVGDLKLEGKILGRGDHDSLQFSPGGIVIDDPDRLHLTTNPIVFYRADATPGICDAADSWHVHDRDANQRGQIAARHKDMTDAVCWYYLSAIQGSPESQERMAYYLTKGIGVKQDLPQALLWAQKAAFHGYTPGMQILASMYQDGTGTPANAAAADYWGHAAFVHSFDDFADWFYKPNSDGIVPAQLLGNLLRSNAISGIPALKESIRQYETECNAYPRNTQSCAKASEAKGDLMQAEEALSDRLEQLKARQQELASRCAGGAKDACATAEKVKAEFNDLRRSDY